MQTAESSQRGFIITGNEIYLGPYQTAKAQAQRTSAGAADPAAGLSATPMSR